MLSVENLQLHIEGKEILKGIDLHLQPGDIYGLLGPNGAGKSTTIFALLGLRERSGGQINVLGHDPRNHAVEIRRAVGVMPEQAGFYDWMTALAYLRWYSCLYAQSPGDRDLWALLEKVGLGSVCHRPILTYSRGMKQRLAVARSLAVHPRLLILDEPTNGLDPKGRREIHDLLLDFTADRKAGLLLSTHLLDDVDRNHRSGTYAARGGPCRAAGGAGGRAAFPLAHGRCAGQLRSSGRAFPVGQRGWLVACSTSARNPRWTFRALGRTLAARLAHLGNSRRGVEP
jgi:ABC-type multidrug transport system ATPase subunit